MTSAGSAAGSVLIFLDFFLLADAALEEDELTDAAAAAAVPSDERSMVSYTHRQTRHAQT